MNRYRHISPAERAEIWRRVKSRSRIENGVITVHFIKILPGPKPAPSQAVCYKLGCNRSGVYEFEMAFWCAEHYPGKQGGYYTGPERPEQWTPYLCNLPGCDKPTGPLMAYCCAEHWAASLTPPSPPWADKEAAGLICSACGYRYVSPETWICGSCGADANEVPWPGGAA